MFNETPCYLLVFSDKTFICFTFILTHLDEFEMCEFILVNIEVLGCAFHRHQWIFSKAFFGHEISIVLHDKPCTTG